MARLASRLRRILRIGVIDNSQSKKRDLPVQFSRTFRPALRSTAPTATHGATFSWLLAAHFFVHFLPELFRRFAVDRLQRLNGAQKLTITVGEEIALEVFEGCLFQR